MVLQTNKENNFTIMIIRKYTSNIAFLKCPYMPYMVKVFIPANSYTFHLHMSVVLL